MRRWGGARLVEVGMGPPRPSGRGTRMFSLSILRRWTLAPSRSLACGASRGAWLLAPSVPPASEATPASHIHPSATFPQVMG